MSWCRWSSLDFRCDLYVFESAEGVEVNVAGSRHAIDYDSVPPAVSILDGVDRWIERHDKFQALLDAAPLISIDLPYAGEYRTFDTLTEAADWIDELAALGYVVPDGMTDEMRASEDPAGGLNGDPQ